MISLFVIRNNSALDIYLRILSEPMDSDVGFINIFTIMMIMNNMNNITHSLSFQLHPIHLLLFLLFVSSRIPFPVHSFFIFLHGFFIFDWIG